MAQAETTSGHGVPERNLPAMLVSRGPLVSTVVVRAVAAVWVAVWLSLGAWTGYEVNALRSLSDTVVKSGGAMRTTGEALQGLGAIPFVGGDVSRVGRRVSLAGASAEQSGRSSRTTIDRLAILLGLAVGLVPTVPVLVLYVLLRRTILVGEPPP
jgi:hypothetical protein